MWKILLILCLLPIYASADEITVDTTGWTQHQKNMREAIAYRLMYASGKNVVPKVDGDRIIFDGVKIEDIEKAVSGQKILDALVISMQENEAAYVIEQQAISDRKNAIRLKVKTALDLTDEETDRLVTFIVEGR